MPRLLIAATSRPSTFSFVAFSSQYSVTSSSIVDEGRVRKSQEVESNA